MDRLSNIKQSLGDFTKTPLSTEDVTKWAIENPGENIGFWVFLVFLVMSVFGVFGGLFSAVMSKGEKTSGFASSVIFCFIYSGLIFWRIQKAKEYELKLRFERNFGVDL